MISRLTIIALTFMTGLTAGGIIQSMRIMHVARTITCPTELAVLAYTCGALQGVHSMINRADPLSDEPEHCRSFRQSAQDHGFVLWSHQ